MNQLQMVPENLCEITTNGFVKVPALFFSNITFLLVGALILIMVWRLGKNYKRFYMFGTGTILVGICSSIYHFMHDANYLIWDMVGIAVLMSVFTYFSFDKSIKLRPIVWAFLAGIFVTFIALISINISNMIAFAVIGALYLGVLLKEFWLKNYNIRQKRLYLIYAVGLQILGTIFSISERYGILCDTNNHFIQGHAIWHVLTAISIYFVFLHFSQDKQQSNM